MAKSGKKMSQEKKQQQNDSRARRKNVYRFGALALGAIMVISLIAMYAIR